MTAIAPASEKTNRAQTRLLKFYEIGDALEICREWLLEPDNQDKLLEAGGDLDALPELKELLEGVELDFAIKAEHVALMAREFELTGVAIKSEIDRLTRLRKAADTAFVGLKAYIRVEFLRANVKKVEGTRMKPRVQINPPSVVSTLTADELSQLAALESPFVRTETPAPTIDIDRDAVLAVWKHAEGTVGKSPDVGDIGYHEKRAAWEAAMDQALRSAGVPAGVSVERGYHTRLS